MMAPQNMMLQGGVTLPLGMKTQMQMGLCVKESRDVLVLEAPPQV